MRKGQYAVVEQILLFGVGITIALGLLAAFQVVGDDIRGETASTQTELLSQYMAANTVELAESGAEGKFIFDLPDKLAGQGYAIKYANDGIVTVTSGAKHTAGVHGLSSLITLDGSIESGEQSVAVTFENQHIQLSNEQ